MAQRSISAQNSMRDESVEHRSYVMSKVPSKGTKPEIIVRKYLFSKGYRYRINDKRLPGTPDIVLPKYRSVLFVHGCFWHGHNGCSNYRAAKTNTSFWSAKITRNQERDQEVWRLLEAKGWNVIIIWECQLKKNLIQDTLKRVEAEIINNGIQYVAEREARKAARLAYIQSRRSQSEKENILNAELQ